jgi:hypothetical protein
LTPLTVRRVVTIRRLAAVLVGFALTANAFDGCLTDVGTVAAAMACCKHHRDDCRDAMRASDCCKARNAGTRIADASTILVASPVAVPTISTTPVVLLAFDQLTATYFPPFWSADASPPAPSPPLTLPLRI